MLCLSHLGHHIEQVNLEVYSTVAQQLNGMFPGPAAFPWHICIKQYEAVFLKRPAQPHMQGRVPVLPQFQRQCGSTYTM